MKFTPLAKIALPLLLACPATAEESTKPVYRDAETHDHIVRKLQANREIGQMKDFAPAQGEDPTLKNQPKDLISSSDVISFNGLTTLVPKRSIIRIPENYASRINSHQPGNRVVGWMAFFTRNRGWITTVDVSREQAEGREPLAGSVTENLSRNRNLIVATYSTGPISLLPPKATGETESTETASKQ